MADLMFAEWLKRQRKAAGLTQGQLAQQIGCSTITLRKIEAEERRPSEQIAERIADIFNISKDEQVGFIRFARGNWESFTGMVQVESWQEAKTSPRSNLPASINSFVGRETDVAELRKYLQKTDTRLVTLVGPPGIGKTRLGIEVGRSLLQIFNDGVFFIPLAPIEDPALIASAIMEGLDYMDSRDQEPLQHLIRAIGDKCILLVLDNCEHVIDAVASLASGLLLSCPRLKILATSRESLRVPGEWLYSPPALGTPEVNSQIGVGSIHQFPALQLFEERARAVRAGFALTKENIREVASICSQLDGLPLAIELLAARIRLMSPQSLLERMTDMFILSVDGMRSVPERQKTLSNAIRWSYDFLTDAERELFESLSVFTGGFLLETPDEIFAESFSSIAVPDLVLSLSDKSLLKQTLQADGKIRFSMLITIQQFALEHLHQSGQEEMMRDLHLAYYIELGERSDAEFQTPRQLEWINRIQDEHDNIRVALKWSVSRGKTESALRLLNAMGWHWQIKGHYREALHWLSQIRALPDAERFPVMLARILGHIGRNYWTQENPKEARRVLEDSLRLSFLSTPEAEFCYAESSIWLGLVALFSENDLEQAGILFERAFHLYEKHNDTWGMAFGTLQRGVLAGYQHRYDEAFSCYFKSLSVFHELGDLVLTARVSMFIALTYLGQGDYEQAGKYLEERLRIDTQLQFWDGIADGLLDLGDLYNKRGDSKKAYEYYEQCRTISREHGLTKTVNPASLAQNETIE